MNKTSYTLLIANERNCADCDSRAVYILLGTENEFLGFYCGPHGVEIKNKLEKKYNFQVENRWAESIIKKTKNYRHKLKSKLEKQLSPKQVAKEVRKGIEEQRRKKEIEEMIQDIINKGESKK